MRKIKFRAWDKIHKSMEPSEGWLAVEFGGSLITTGPFSSAGHRPSKDKYIIMQYTGLKDKNGLTYIYECDILDDDGMIIGNIFKNKGLLNEKENVKNPSHLIIQGLGTSAWEATNKKAMERGCKYSE